GGWRVLPAVARLRLVLFALLLASLLAGCAGVNVSSFTPRDYIHACRGEILSTGTPSTVGINCLQVLRMEANACSRYPRSCISDVRIAQGLSDEQRASILSELWLQEAITLENLPEEVAPNKIVDAYLQSARQAYAYLFLTERRPDERALEGRQMQVR